MRRKEVSGMPISHIQCGWCQSNHPYPLADSNCSNCGGPLPHTDVKLGAAPPSVPRTLPKQFSRTLKWKNAKYKISFLVMGTSIIFIPIAGPFSLLFFIIGYFTFKEARKKLNGRLLALEKGYATEGRVTAVYLDKSVHMLGKNPGKVEYVFKDDDGVRHFDFKTSWGSSVLTYNIGDSIWIVYVKDDPKQNDIWPPIT